VFGMGLPDLPVDCIDVTAPNGFIAFQEKDGYVRLQSDVFYALVRAARRPVAPEPAPKPSASFWLGAEADHLR
jgi:hypothetical protein